MATVNLTHSQVNGILRDYLAELGDDAYQSFLMKVVQDGKHRRFDKQRMVGVIKKRWHEPKEGRKSPGISALLDHWDN
jgi:hypothetical protein